MITWINGINDGELAPSLMYASELAAQRALSTLLSGARAEGRAISQQELADLHVWIVRDQRGSILKSWWISSDEHGPALRYLVRS